VISGISGIQENGLLFILGDVLRNMQDLLVVPAIPQGKAVYQQLLTVLS
jgi:hypothetical protein